MGEAYYLNILADNTGNVLFSFKWLLSSVTLNSEYPFIYLSNGLYHFNKVRKL